MPRRPRLAIAGIPWHVIQRGNNRTACFLVESDCRYYLEQLGELSARFDCAVHAYVLMTNHVHLLLTPAREPGASLLMKHLGQRYAQRFNRSHGRTGTLWEGRFRSCLTQSEEYVIACYRYIELNPVRAGLARHPADYPWSSYPANGEGRIDGLVTPHPEFLRLIGVDGAHRSAYRELVMTRLDAGRVAEIRRATNGNVALGAGEFQTGIESALGRRARRGRPGRPPRPSA